jgi:hypothetical protein
MEKKAKLHEDVPSVRYRRERQANATSSENVDGLREVNGIVNVSL